MALRRLLGVCNGSSKAYAWTMEVTSTCCLAGEKLSESTAADVRELCSTLLNCYLIQVTFTLLARIQH